MSSGLLDPGSEAFLNLLRTAGGKPLYEQTVEEALAFIASRLKAALHA
jgi:hypothetical protein